MIYQFNQKAANPYAEKAKQYVTGMAHDVSCRAMLEELAKIYRADVNLARAVERLANLRIKNEGIEASELPGVTRDFIRGIQTELLREAHYAAGPNAMFGQFESASIYQNYVASVESQYQELKMKASQQFGQPDPYKPQDAQKPLRGNDAVLNQAASKVKNYRY